jgi:hypothetical protein
LLQESGGAPRVHQIVVNKAYQLINRDILDILVPEERKKLRAHLETHKNKVSCY